MIESSYIITDLLGSCVDVGVCIASTVCSWYTTSCELSDCKGFRYGERCLGYRFSVFCYLFSHVWVYHVSAAVFLGVCIPSEVGWETSEVIFPPSEVLVIVFWSGADMIF